MDAPPPAPRGRACTDGAGAAGKRIRKNSGIASWRSRTTGTPASADRQGGEGEEVRERVDLDERVAAPAVRAHRGEQRAQEERAVLGQVLADPGTLVPLDGQPAKADPSTTSWRGRPGSASANTSTGRPEPTSGLGLAADARVLLVVRVDDHRDGTAGVVGRHGFPLRPPRRRSPGRRDDGTVRTSWRVPGPRACPPGPSRAATGPATGRSRGSLATGLPRTATRRHSAGRHGATRPRLGCWRRRSRHERRPAPGPRPRAAPGTAPAAGRGTPVGLARRGARRLRRAGSAPPG